MPPPAPHPRRAPSPAQADSGESSAAPAPSPRQRLAKAWGTLVHHGKRHVGVGIICAVAYFDPGNWSVDLQAGSQFGYKLLFMVLLSGLGAVVLQVLACKLGCVTGLDLAAHCRLLLHDHPKYPRFVRYFFLYPLYFLSELAIISTDLAELLGSAIGLVLIFPKLPLPIAVLITAVDVFFILLVGDPSKGHGRPVRMFEYFIIILVIVVFSCFVVLIIKVSPHWPAVFDGYIPSRALVEPSGLFAAIGILGATVMPHALYLGSYMATQDRVSTVAAPLALPTPPAAQRRSTLRTVLRALFSGGRTDPKFNDRGVDIVTPHGERDNNPLSFIRAHLKHGIADIVLSLVGFAVAINSAILVLAGAVFFFGPGKVVTGATASLFDAHALIGSLIGKPAAVVFALALIASGQSASITATLAGQIVSEGFIQWRVSPFFRRLLTRLLSLVPAMVVAIVVGKPGITTLLNISQVVLSMVLPFAMFPLVWLTSSSMVMRVKRPREIVRTVSDAELSPRPSLPETSEGPEKAVPAEISEKAALAVAAPEFEAGASSEKGKEKQKDGDTALRRTATADMNTDWVDEEADDYVDYSNGWPLTILSYAIWLVILIANGYLIVTLALA